MKMQDYKLSFSTFDVLKIFDDIKQNTLQDWVARDFIVASQKTQVARGMKSHFSRWDIYLIRLFKRLIETGFIREYAAEIIKVLSADGLGKSFKNFAVIREGGKVKQIQFLSGENANLPENFDDVILINFESVKLLSDEKIDKWLDGFTVVSRVLTSSYDSR